MIKNSKNIKNLINKFYLRNLVLAILNFYAKIFTNHISIRNGIKYSLDLSEAIDFATYFGGWEPETIEFIENTVKKGDYVIEVGANVGVQTLHLAKKVGHSGKVFAIEPTEFALKKLYKNCELNPELKERIEIFKYLITDEKHSTPITTIRASWQINRSRDNDEIINEQLALTIDEFVINSQIERLDILKIDVDGYDYKVLQGSESVILKYKPIVYIELGEEALNLQGDTVTDILKYFSKMNYEGRLASNPKEIISNENIKKLLKLISHVNAVFVYKKIN